MQFSFRYIIFLVFLLSLGCEKDRTTETNPIECPYPTDFTDVREWYYFREGTYWVYQEQNTLAYDTVTVIESVLDSLEEFQGFEFTTLSTFNDELNFFEYSSNADGSTFYSPFCSLKKLKLESYSIDWGVNSIGTAFVTPVFVGQKVHFDGGVENVNTIISLQDSIILNESYLVAVWSMSDTYPYNDQNSFVSLAKGLGLVKKISSSGIENWQLVDFYLN